MEDVVDNVTVVAPDFLSEEDFEPLQKRVVPVPREEPITVVPFNKTARPPRELTVADFARTLRPTTSGPPRRKLDQRELERRRDRMVGRAEKFRAETEQLQRLHEVELEASLLRARAREEQKFRNLMEQVDNKEHEREVEGYLAIRDLSEARKREQRYTTWEAKVFGALQERVQEKLDATPVSAIEQRRRDEFETYLKATSQMSSTAASRAALREQEREREAGKGRSRAIRVDVSDINRSDPLKADLMKHNQEARLFGGTPIQPQPRDVLNLALWSRLESTPSGRYARMFEEGAKPHIKRNMQHGVSHIEFDHFSPPAPDAALQENPIKRRILTRPRSFDIVSNANSNGPAAAPASAAAKAGSAIVGAASPPSSAPAPSKVAAVIPPYAVEGAAGTAPGSARAVAAGTGGVRAR